jgi:hypothetical protein
MTYGPLNFEQRNRPGNLEPGLLDGTPVRGPQMGNARSQASCFALSVASKGRSFV